MSSGTHVSRETSVLSTALRAAPPCLPRPDSSPSPARSCRPAVHRLWLPSLRDDHGRGRIQIVPSTCHHPDIPRAQRLHHTPMLTDLVGGPLAFHRQHPAPGSKQWQAPSRQLVQRRHRSGHNRVHLPHSLPHGLFFRSATDHGDIHAEVLDDLLQGIRFAAAAARSVSPADPAGPTPTVSLAAPLHYRCRQSHRRDRATRRAPRC